jgi:hypothetical protein
MKKLAFFFLFFPNPAHSASEIASSTPRHEKDMSVELKAFKAEIRRLYDIKEKAFASDDADLVLNEFYSADAISAAEGSSTVEIGRQALKPIYEAGVKDIKMVRIESVHTYVNGSAGWDWVNFYLEPKPEKAAEYPKSPLRMLFLWSKENGAWVCKGDMYIQGGKF